VLFALSIIYHWALPTQVVFRITPKADEVDGRRVERDCDLEQGERGELVRRDTAAQ